MQNTDTETHLCSFSQLQQALLTLRQQQEALAEENTPDIEIDEEREEVQGEELEHYRREQPQHQHLNHRKKERSKESMYKFSHPSHFNVHRGSFFYLSKAGLY